MKGVQFSILLFVNLLCANSLAIAQPDSDSEIENHIIKGNELFRDGAYQEALVNYRKVIEHQSSNNYVAAKINKAEDELLYKAITDGVEIEANSREYIHKYGKDGKYIFNVKGILGQELLDQAYKHYNNKKIAALETTYIDYLILLGSEKSREMKQWLYLLCAEKAEDYSDQKQWQNAMVFFEKSLKYATNDRQFSEAQKGIEHALKKK
jgi:tetratricopeptide (TPR) repeat protein